MKRICPECEKKTEQTKVSETYLCHGCCKEHETIIENKETCRDCEGVVSENEFKQERALFEEWLSRQFPGSIHMLDKINDTEEYKDMMTTMMLVGFCAGYRCKTP